MSRPTKSAYAIAAHLGMDGDDFEHYRYQSTRYSRPVYAVDDALWSAGAKPPTDAYPPAARYEWKEVRSTFDGCRLWRATDEEPS